MASLQDLYNSIVIEEELEKEAAQEAVSELVEESLPEEETVKVAAEYDAAGRIMARAYFDEMLKAAAEGKEEEEEEEEEEEDEDKKKKEKKGLPPAFANALAEKKAALKQRMLEDPEFAQAMFERYGQ